MQHWESQRDWVGDVGNDSAGVTPNAPTVAHRSPNPARSGVGGTPPGKRRIGSLLKKWQRKGWFWLLQLWRDLLKQHLNVIHSQC